MLPYGLAPVGFIPYLGLPCISFRYCHNCLEASGRFFFPSPVDDCRHNKVVAWENRELGTHGAV